ncbi:MAG: ATP-binding cassette domain-containing protein [Helcococcus sp.]|nr:ATP-binding cassette domain-containing protein [Helcococcus sp.]
MLEFNKVSKTYNTSKFNINDISFVLGEKEILGLIGRNGTGKSTILKMANKLVTKDCGQIIYNNKNYDEMNEKEIRKLRQEIVYIFQDANLLLNKSVLYHLELPFKLSKRKVDYAEMEEILDFMNINDLKHVKTRYLSGGQRQKVAIAMAILQKPSILLCDEISSALDTKAEKEIFDLLKILVDKYNISILMISHNFALVKSFCDRILLIENQTIQQEIVPNKSDNAVEEDYYRYVMEYFND